MDAKTIATGLIKAHEGLRLTLYADSKGAPTVGYGRDLVSQGITITEANILLDDDICYFLDKLGSLDWFVRMDNVRQAAIIDMAYNLGLKGLFEFSEMINALMDGKWQEAAEACLNSEWAKQVEERAADIAYILRLGKLPSE